MRIHFDNANFASKTGPNTFATRLAKCLIESGHDVLNDGSDADVSLVFIEPTGRPLAKKIVQRLDGIWFKPEEFHVKNRNIEKLYRTADTIIWQSDFDRMMTLKWWGIPGNGTGQIIRNGIDLTRVDKVTIPELAKIRSSYDRVFVCSSNWHPQKRLRSNIELFEHVRKTQHPNSCLFILGSNPDVMTTDPHVFYTGAQPPEVYLQIFAISDWMFHLAWADHCPNVVVEALSQGTPVVCSNVGGTSELVQKFGVIYNDKPYDFELADYDNPPTVDVSQISLPKKEELGDHSDIDIRHKAESYVRVFEDLVHTQGKQ